MIKWNKKKIGVILAVCLMASNNVYAAPESSQSTIDTLLASTNPHDHIEALKIMEANGAKVTKITINEFDALKALNEKLEDGKDERAQVYSAAYSARTAHPFQRNGAPFRFKLSKAQQVD